MANTKDELRVSRNFVNLIKDSQSLLYKILNKLFDIADFSMMQKVTANDIKLEEPFEGVGRMDILIENPQCFFIIENKVHSPTETQDTQTTTYFDLLNNKKKEGKQTFICYLINKGHPIEDFEKAVKKNENSKIVFWNDLINDLYKTSESYEKRLIESFVLYSKDEIDNFSIDLDGKEKIFGDDSTFYSNPYLLSTLDKFLFASESEQWIFNTFVVPAFESIEHVTNVHIDDDDGWKYVVFTFEGKEYWVNLTSFWNPVEKDWFYHNSFTYYRPWIVGCNEATTEKQMMTCTKNAILLWLHDEIAQYNPEKFDDTSNEVFGDDKDLFSNPLLLANVNYLITQKKPKKKTLDPGNWLYEEIIIPACKRITELKNPKIREYYREVSIKAEYKGCTIDFDLNGFYETKTNSMHDYHTFTFYRPWIVGVRYATNIVKMIDYTERAIRMWLSEVAILLDLK